MLANIIRNRKKTAIGGGGGGIVTDGDPYYSAVSMLLPMDGTNGSTTFTDSGPNALAVTATSATISTTQSKYGASGYFNGTSAYLTAASSAITLGTSDFTIEFWIYPLDVRTFSLYDSRTNETNPNGNGFVIGTSATQAWVVYQAGNKIVGPTVVANQWTHVAVTRSGSSVKMWINGVQVGSTWTTTGSFSDGATLIGTDYPKNARFVYGYVDDFRISLFARYVSTFTPPTAALPTTVSSTVADPYYGYTSLLLHMDGSNASTNFVDSGPSALTVTAVGNTQISTTQSKYGGASGYFDGTGDYLSISPNTAIDLSSGNFTIEFWIRPAPKTNAVDAAFGYGNYACMFYHNGTNWTLEMSSTGFSNQLVISFAVTLNTWQHIAIVRSGTSVVVYKDGVSSASGTFTGTVATSGRTLRIGDNGNSQNINGYIDDFRITKYARYTSAFAPPTQALPEYATGNDRYFSNTSLLLHMDGANGSTAFTDNSANALAITRTGTAAISTAQSQFGGASAYFDGATGYLSLTGNSSFQFGTGDFTVEMWVYISANAANQQTFLDTRGTATATPFTFGIYQSKLGFYDGTMRQSSATVTTGQWYHFSACRSGGTLRLFIDGISYYSASSTTNFTTGANSIYIGRGFDSAAYYTNGYIDDIRISKFARYSANFTPPTSAFPNA